ncbi:MAG: zinc-dependent alcohol dehydrogenase [Pseudolysinimonas sp.]
MVYTSPRIVELRDVPEPVPEDGEVVIEVETVGVCGSELHGIRHANPFRVPPLIMGHEFVGRRLDTGERVAVNPLIACGMCDLCRLGASNVCRERVILGIGRAGAFAERVAVPVRNLHSVSAELDSRRGALVEPLANAMHAWRLVEPRHPERVGIIGAGTVGLSTAIALLAAGVPRVDIVDRADERLGVARRLGVHGASGKLGDGYDVVVDAVGTSATRAMAVNSTRPAGAALWLGLEDEDTDIDVRALIRTERSVLTSFCYRDDDFADAVRVAATVDAGWVELVPLEDGPAAFTALMNGRTEITKVALQP